MNLGLVDQIANAILYEGYLLYPYRASAVKNRQRWNFGAVYPEAFSIASGGTDACLMQTQCLVVGNEGVTLEVRVRFLHFLAREVFELIDDGASRFEDQRSAIVNNPDIQSSITDPQSSPLRLVESLEIGGERFQTWQEAVEREASTGALPIGELITAPKRTTFSFPAHHETQPLANSDGSLAGVLSRRQQALGGEIEVSAERLDDQLFKITARILNRTAMDGADLRNRDEALMRTLVSTHTIVGVREGGFVSALDPPEELRDSACACVNVGTYPVLVGEQDSREVMLSSPIILYDYPQIAPESAGDLFDSTEIDEILTLRILTLTDEEKREMRQVDDRARQILERTETMPLEQLMKLHGAVRGLRPVSVDDERLGAQASLPAWLKGEATVVEREEAGKDACAPRENR